MWLRWPRALRHWHFSIPASCLGSLCGSPVLRRAALVFPTSPAFGSESGLFVTILLVLNAVVNDQTSVIRIPDQGANLRPQTGRCESGVGRKIGYGVMTHTIKMFRKIGTSKVFGGV